jgi:hypothetical protein
MTLAPVMILSPLSLHISNLNLGRGSAQRPNINGLIDQDGDLIGDAVSGWNGAEYDLFTKYIPMYIGGNQEGQFKVGIARLAYDCQNEILCGATYLDAASISVHAHISTPMTRATQAKQLISLPVC